MEKNLKLAEKISNSKEFKSALDGMIKTFKGFANSENLPWEMRSKLPPVWNNCVKRTHEIYKSSAVIIGHDNKLLEYFSDIESGKTPKDRKISILDVGCGISQYSCIFKYFGFENYVGIDLFGKRVGHSEMGRKSMKCAERIVEDQGFKIHKVIAGDVNNLKEIISSSLPQFESQKFDVILAAGTQYKKGKEGISNNLLKNICADFLKDDGHLINVALASTDLNS